MSNELTVASAAVAPSNFGEAIRLAEIMATGKLVPVHLQKSPGDCLMVIEQASRWGMSPLAVAQCTSVIHGKLMYEGKLVAAAIQASGILSDRLDYTFTGDGDNRKVTVSATMRGETKPRTVEVFLRDAKTANDIWKKQPDQQLTYHGARVWGRRHAPEVILGVYSPEEMPPESPRDVTPPPRPQREATTQIALSAPEPQQPASQAQDRPMRFAITDADGNEHLYEKGSEYLENFRKFFADAPSKDGFWDTNSGHFQEWHTKLVQKAEREGATVADKKAAAAFTEVSRGVMDALSQQAAA